MSPKKTIILLSLIVSCFHGKQMNESLRKTHWDTTTSKRPIIGEEVVEKFVETLIDSEKYLKQIKTVEKKLDHLDLQFHEKSNNMMKYLAEMLRMLKASPAEMLDKALNNMKIDLDKLKQAVTTRLGEHPSLRSKL